MSGTKSSVLESSGIVHSSGEITAFITPARHDLTGYFEGISKTLESHSSETERGSVL